MEGCNACQRNKNQTQPLTGKLMPNLVPEKAWTHISVDFVTKLPLAQGYDVILVVVDRFTKMAHFIPTIEKTSTEGLCHKLHSAITPQILARFPRSRLRLKALKKTFRTMPKTCQSNQYSSRYQLISAGH